MASELDIAFDALDPRDLGAVTKHAVERIRAGIWTSDAADVLGRYVLTFHGGAALEKFLDAVEAEVKRYSLI